MTKPKSRANPSSVQPSPASQPVADVESVFEEDDGGGNSQSRPWDPAKIRITTKNFTLREVASQIENEEIDLAPDFQRAFVWKDRQRTRLIESILLGIPLPAFYFNQTDDGRFQVVDGVQRLSTIKQFMAGVHALDAGDLEYLKSLGGCAYGSLDQSLKRRFANTQIVVHVIEPQTPDEVKYDIFSRVNTLGSPLSAQEIRHAMSKPRSREFLSALVAKKNFELATDRYFMRTGADGADVHFDKRMADRELALRFCAFRESKLEDYRPFESLDAFLLNMTHRLDGSLAAEFPLGTRDLARLEGEFDTAMMNSHLILGKQAFRRTMDGLFYSGKRGPLNRALFEAQALALVDITPAQVQQHKEALAQRLRALLTDPWYLSAVTVGTGDFEKVKLRLTETRKAVEQVVK